MYQTLPPLLLFHSLTGHLEFHCQNSLGPCVWASESYKDHIALPLQSQIHSHAFKQAHAHTHTHTAAALKGGPRQNPHPLCNLCPISTYLLIQLPYRQGSYNISTSSVFTLNPNKVALLLYTHTCRSVTT